MVTGLTAIHHHRLPVLVHDLAGVLRIALPIAEPLLEVGRANHLPLVLVQLRGLAVRGEEIALLVAHNLHLIELRQELTVARVGSRAL